jgi:hypothetical protein
VRHVRTPNSTSLFRLPGGTEENDLYVERCQDANGRTVLTSTWELDDDDRAAIAAGATIELLVWGHGHPPVAVAVGASMEERSA